MYRLRLFIPASALKSVHKFQFVVKCSEQIAVERISGGQQWEYDQFYCATINYN